MMTLLLKKAKPNDLLMLYHNLTIQGKYLLCASVITTSFLDFANQWIWNPFWTIYFLILVMIADFCSGLALSLKRGEGFSTKKMSIFIISSGAFLMLLTCTFNLGKINDVFGFPPITPILVLGSRVFYLLFFLNTMLSCGKNLSLGGFLTGKVGLFFLKYIDGYKNRVEDILIHNDEVRK